MYVHSKTSNENVLKKKKRAMKFFVKKNAMKGTQKKTRNENTSI